MEPMRNVPVAQSISREIVISETNAFQENNDSERTSPVTDVSGKDKMKMYQSG